jgi:hypothetical protein
MSRNSVKSLIMSANQIARDAEEILRRCSDLIGKLSTIGTLSAIACDARDAQGARQAGARVLSDLNSINIKGGGVKVDKSTARAPGISLGFMFRNLPRAIPHHFALWWWRSMKERDWVLSRGGFVDAQNWKYQLSAWYKHVDTSESVEAKETYERFFGKAFPRQEETAAEVWEETCRGCDKYWAGHCVACALKPPKSAAVCKRFVARTEEA